VCKTCIYVKIYINIVGKFTIFTIVHKVVAWAVVRGTVFIFIVYIFFFLSIVGLLLYRCIRIRQEYSNGVSSRMSNHCNMKRKNI
jgi:hypothetical protein